MSEFATRQNHGTAGAGRLALVFSESAPVGKGLKYARREFERRFLFSVRPEGEVIRVARILDRYLVGTRLRLREAVETTGDGEVARTVFKLTQKVPRPRGEPGLITTIYLDAAEHALLAQLPAASLRKTRLSIPPLGVDLFEDELAGLVLAEAEFADERSMRGFAPPAGAVAEVTRDVRLSGGRLVSTSSGQLAAVLADYGLTARRVVR